MTNKTRKHIWQVSLVASIAIIGILAAFVVLASNPGVTMAHGDATDHEAACAAMTDAQRNHHNATAILNKGEELCDAPDDGNGNGGMMGAATHASMPVMFGLEGLDNGARLNWRQPKLRAPGAEVIGYRIDRDAWNSDANHPINKYNTGDKTIDLLNLPSVLAADHSDRGLAYETVYIYKVQAIVEYDVKRWWNNLTPAMKNTVVIGGGMYDLQAGKYPVGMVDAWWNNLNCTQMNDAVSPMSGEPVVGSDNPGATPRSPYCYMYDDLSPAAVTVVGRAHMNSYNRYAFGAWSSLRSIETAVSGGLIDALLAPPSAPRDVDAVSSCEDQIMLTWKAPADNGKVPAEFPGCATCTDRTPTHIGGDDAGIEIQPGTAVITGYMVERKVGDGAWEILDSNVTGISYVDDDEDLAYGMTYQYRVRAMNNANLTGPAGMDTLPLDRPDRPQRPSSLVVNLEQGASEFELQWDPPTDSEAGSVPKPLWRTKADFDAAKLRGDFRSGNLSYLVQRQVDDSPWKSVLMPTDDLQVGRDLHMVTAPGGERQYALRHLYSREGLSTILTQEHIDPAIARGTEALDVRYRVSALVNACNPSPWNQADEVEIPAAGAPEKPEGLTAKAMGQNQIDLSWTAPNDGGSAITGYTFEYSMDGGDTWSDPMDTDSMTSHSHTGLMAGTAYTYRVTAMNEVDNSMASATSMATTAAPPMLGTITNLALSNSLELTWTPAVSATSQIAIVVNVADDTEFCLAPLAASASSYACTAITPTAGTAYVGLVTASDGSGGSTVSNFPVRMVQ